MILTQNVNKLSRATPNSTRKACEKFEFFCIQNFNLILFYISTLGDDINNISLFFILKKSQIFIIYLVINIFILKIINFL